jgi:hypothetical protein
MFGNVTYDKTWVVSSIKKMDEWMNFCPLVPKSCTFLSHWKPLVIHKYMLFTARKHSDFKEKWHRLETTYKLFWIPYIHLRSNGPSLTFTSYLLFYKELICRICTILFQIWSTCVQIFRMHVKLWKYVYGKKALF